MSRNDIVRTDGSINYDYLGESIDGLSSQMADIAIQVGTYFALVNNLGQTNEDWSLAIQQAVKVAILNNKPISFPAGKILQVYTPINLSGNTKIIIYGNNSTIKLMNQPTGSVTPAMFFSSLKNPTTGTDATQIYDYNTGVYIENLNFDGDGHGIGYKHLVAGNCHIKNCVFETGLEIGCMLSGTNFIYFDDCKLDGNIAGLWCSVIGEDSWFPSAIAPAGLGWNDGIYITNSEISGGKYGVYYGGSEAEGILAIENSFLGNGSEAVIYAYAPFVDIIISGCWSEFATGKSIISTNPSKDNASPGYNLTIKNNHFAQIQRVQGNLIINVSLNANIEQNYFQSTNPNILINTLSGGKNSEYFSITGDSTGAPSGLSTISFPKNIFPYKCKYLIGNDGTNLYFLEYVGIDYPSGSYQFNVYQYKEITSTLLSPTYEKTQRGIVNGSTLVLNNWTLIPAFVYSKPSCIIKQNIFNQPPDKVYNDSIYCDIIPIRNYYKK